MSYIFRCKECGFRSPVPEGGGWSTCPDCGGNRISVQETKQRAAPAQPEVQPPGAEEESK